MGISIGLDIGGTKIAGAIFDAQGEEITQIAKPTPPTYESFLEICGAVVAELEEKAGRAETIGACAPYVDETTCANMPMLIGKKFGQDLEHVFKRPVAFGNDANCAALAEAKAGAGRGYRLVCGLIMGTGFAGGLILNGQILSGANGLCGEIGHLPLPCYEPSDGELVACGCGQTGCIEKLVAGAALARLYHAHTGKNADARLIGEQARQGQSDALRVLDIYYTVVAKAMITVLHSFDPDIITVSGGLNSLPGMYDEVPKRWGRYAIKKNPVTRFIPASFGATAGLRGAAWLGKAGC